MSESKLSIINEKMDKKLIFILMITFAFAINAMSQIGKQKLYQISGKVTSKNTNEAIAFASVGIINASQTTVTNLDGNFIYNFLQLNQNDTLAVFAVGFNTFKISILDAIEMETLNVALTTISQEIKEITIVGLSPLQILQKALESINTKYSKHNYVSEAFYREVISEQEEHKRIVEAAVKILEPGYVKARNRKFNQVVNVHKIKRFNDDRKHQNYDWNGLQYIMNENIFGLDARGILSAYNLTDWKFTHENTTKVQGEIAYVLKFVPKDEKVVRPSGKIYIAANDFSILQLTWNLNEAVKKWQNTVLPNNDFLQFKRWEMTFSYKRIKEKLYLNYVFHNRNFDLHSFDDNAKYTSIDIYNELIVNDINKQSVLELLKRKTKNFENAFKKPITENENYWSKYNIAVASKRLQKYYSVLDAQ